MTPFEQLKNELCEKAKKADACTSEYKKAYGANTEAEILKVIYDNLQWCINHKVISNEYLSKFDPLTFLNSGIANTGLENTGFANSGYRNSGNRNSGDRNSGDSNSGDRNSGNRNSGNRNSGYRNSGNRNSGNWNSGDSNSGYSNSGYSNSGDSNSGDWNSGDRNSGNWNSGYSNSGDSNSGYRNSGAFCTDNNPKAILFNRESSLTIREWENHPAYSVMANYLNFTFWINASEMTEKEKIDHPKYETTEGYLKTISHKEGWSNMWGNLSEANKSAFKSIPNFDANIFEEITGIKI